MRKIILIIIASVLIVGVLILFLINNTYKEKVIEKKEITSEVEKAQKPSLGSLCQSEENCISFCLNNRAQCTSYCKENENELCKIIFPVRDEEENIIRNEKQDITKKCEGTKTTFDFAPVNLEKTLVMLPRGLMTGDHVTPVNHHYFQNFNNDKFDIEVYSPGKGYITAIAHMPGAEEGKDYHITIQHTCTISAYYIYVSNLPDKLKAFAHGTQGYASVHIPVKAGELIGYYKNNLDYNLIDEETKLSGFAVPEHYAPESYKLHIVSNTYEYFNEPIKSKLIEKSIRTTEPISGKIDYDIDGKLVGNWFLEGTNGYGGNSSSEEYWLGHLSIAYDYIDPQRIVISLQGYEAQDSRQFGIKENAPDPAQVSVESGLIKYELVDYEYIAPDGKPWDRKSPVKGLKTTSNELVHGVVLIQMIKQRKIKIEVFPEKTASEVTGFTPNAKIYER